MKKLFFVLVCVLTSLTVSAQKGFSEKSNFGISANIAWDFDRYGEPVSGVIQLSSNRIILDLAICSFADDGVTGGAALGYIFNLNKLGVSKLNLYPLVGVYNQQNNGSSETKFNFGAGAQYHLTGGLFANARVTAKDAAIGVGINF